MLAGCPYPILDSMSWGSTVKRHCLMYTSLSQRRIARVFGARGAYFRSPQTKNCNSPKFAKSLKLFTKFGYLKQNKFLVGRFLVVGGPSGPIFLEDLICFCQCGGAKTSNDFF